jgi:serine/threonine-protein kinase
MMMNHSLKNQCKVSPGTVISGKWHQKRYKIVKELGFGANGIVYLAEQNGARVALKMSDNGLSITSEVNVLKSFAKVQGSSLGPSLLDVDDWQSNQGRISFYVMEYIHGPNFLTFISQKGKSWTVVLLLQLLNDLELLHQNGWVFGDLKPENLIVTGPPTRIRCIDVGGTTIQGRAIKEFTEFYDRGYWGLGSRKAEPGYDLFAVGMVMLNTAYPNRFSKKSGGLLQLREAIRQKPELLPFEKVIVKALEGRYQSAKQMRAELLALATIQQAPSPTAGSNMSKQAIANRPSQKPNQKPSQKPKPESVQKYPSRKTFKKKKKRIGWLETIFIMLLLICIYFVYIMFFI